MAEDEQSSADIQIKVNAALRKRTREIIQIKEDPNEYEKNDKTAQLVRIVSREIGASEDDVERLLIDWLR